MICIYMVEYPTRGNFSLFEKRTCQLASSPSARLFSLHSVSNDVQGVPSTGPSLPIHRSPMTLVFDRTNVCISSLGL